MFRSRCATACGCPPTSFCRVAELRRRVEGEDVAEALLTVLAAHTTQGKAIVLSWYEEFIISMALSMLMVLTSQTKNAAALESIQAAVSFLQEMLYGEPLEQGAIQAGITFLQQLLYGQVPLV